MARLAPPNPYVNHEIALRERTPNTGEWLIQSDQYQDWKYGTTQHLWVPGKAGSGKSVLCSIVVEDMIAHCKENPESATAIFYFSFSDKEKQSSNDLLRSLVSQLTWEGPSFQALHDRLNIPGKLSQQELDGIFESTCDLYKRIHLVLDALDESPAEQNCRTQVLNQLIHLARLMPNISIFATSREDIDIRDAMSQLKARFMPIDSSVVDLDIKKFLTAELSTDPRLQKLDKHTTKMIEETITCKADGMYVLNFPSQYTRMLTETGFVGLPASCQSSRPI